MTTFLAILITGFCSFWIGYKIGSWATLTKLAMISKEMQSILNDLQRSMNQWTEDDL
jgi:hypothetical protein